MNPTPADIRAAEKIVDMIGNEVMQDADPVSAAREIFQRTAAKKYFAQLIAEEAGQERQKVVRVIAAAKAVNKWFEGWCTTCQLCAFSGKQVDAELHAALKALSDQEQEAEHTQKGSQ